MKFKQLSKRRKIAAILSAVLVIALAVTGTMAAFIFDEDITNEWGDVVTPGGTGHDDFEGKDDKDVYFENYGTGQLFVRIRLSEYMEFGTGATAKSLVKGAKRDDVTSWTPHVPSSSATPEHCTPGNLETPGETFHKYWSWQMGSTSGERYYMPTDPTSPTASAVKQGPFYTIADQAANQNRLKPIPNATVITMAEWIANGSQIGNYWVVDTDGWAYWAAPLASKSATGLLLNEAKLTLKPEQSYYYAINVRFQASDKEDIANLRTGASANANALLDKIAGVMSLSDLLDATIQNAEDALLDAAANPGKYTTASINALQTALNDAKDVQTKGAGATDTELQDSIDALNGNLPLTEVTVTPPPATDLPVKAPDNAAWGYAPVQSNVDPDLDYSTQVQIVRGNLDKFERFCGVPLSSIVTGSTAGVTVAAVDPVFANFIEIDDDPYSNAPSVIFSWLPTDTGSDGLSAFQRFQALNNATTSVGTLGIDGAWSITTDVIVTRGTQSATVTMTFLYNHSIIML